MSCIVSPEAERDLDEIADRIAERNLDRALTFTAEILERCNKLAMSPSIGRVRDDLQPGLRSLAHGNYLIFYTETEFGIRIERIIHGARDYETFFENN